MVGLNQRGDDDDTGPLSTAEIAVIQTRAKTRAGRRKSKGETSAMTAVSAMMESVEENMAEQELHPVNEDLDITRSGEKGLTKASAKTGAGSRKGKRRSKSKTPADDVLEVAEKVGFVDGVEPHNETVYVDDMDPLQCAGAMPMKNAKLRQEGKPAIVGVGPSVAKRRRRTGKAEDHQLDSDTCGEKGSESIPVHGKGKRAKGPPRSKGATIKTLANINDQASDIVLGEEYKSISPRVAEYTSKGLEESADHQDIGDLAAGGVENVEGAGGSSLVNEEPAVARLGTHDPIPVDGLDSSKVRKDREGPVSVTEDAVVGAFTKPRAECRRGKRKANVEIVADIVEHGKEVLKLGLSQRGHEDIGPLSTGEIAVVQTRAKTRAGRRRGKGETSGGSIVSAVRTESIQQNMAVEEFHPVNESLDTAVEEKLTKVSTKKRAGSTRGRRTKVVIEGADVDLLEKVVLGDGAECHKETVVVGAIDPGQCAGEILVKNVKLRQRSKAATVGVGTSTMKRRRKTGKIGDPQLNVDACGEKEPEGIPVHGTGKRAKGPSRSKGGTIRALSNIDDQGSDLVLSEKDKSSSPGVEVCDKGLEGSADCDDINERVPDETEKLEGAGGSTLVNLTVDGLGNCIRTEETGSFKDIEVSKKLDNGAVGEDVSSGVTEGEENKASEECIDSAGADAGAATKSWVQCDDCNKWRCIPVELADQIESTNARWSCAENPDKEFGDCSVPQEKSNAEINAELQISEVSYCDEGDDNDAVESNSMNLTLANEEIKPAVWKLIRRNIFQHRRRKVLDIDEMMVCQCNPPNEGEVGCGENCLNRMLSIECVAEQCPCGEACSNQQFQNRTYAPIEMYRCGKKGFGLRVLEPISKGTFITEYIGEVLDVGAFEARQQEYACKGQKHFYFMTLNSNEVIDACSKGNFGRFINHSCEPNCRTEKWMVNGEVCIGLFAITDIPKGEEVTFDYNYVRVCGAAAKKCECGSSQCRGFIGGDPLTPKAVVESDSEDDLDLEPIMLENSEDEDAYVDEKLVTKVPRAEAEFEETFSLQRSGIKRRFTSVKEKAPSTVKRVKTCISTRRNGPMNKGLMVYVNGGRHEGGRTTYFSDVQEKLDEMLDRNGGLRKRRDAAKNYLKLLVLTSASGDNRKDATACSVRDLSLLLEALLRTTSRTVLSDIMNKNGLRMLHNLIKQLCRQWDKTPILRKLIKVLELLASERVLTVDLINSSPPCSGMESFSESLFKLTRHQDVEVVQMVRRFRNRWMHQLYKQSMQSSSPVKIQQSDQVNTAGNKYHSPRHPPQASTSEPLTGLEVCGASLSGIPGPDGGNLPPGQCQILPPFSQEGAMPKDEEKGAVKPSVLGDGPSLDKPEQENKKVRKRPSRWDMPAKVESSGKGLSVSAVSANQSVAQVADFGFSGRQTAWPAPPLPQFQFERPRQFNEKNRFFQPKSQRLKRYPTFRHEAHPGVSSQQIAQGSFGLQKATHSTFQAPRQAVGLPGSTSRLPSTFEDLPGSGNLSDTGPSRQPQVQPDTVAMVAPRVPPAHQPGVLVPLAPPMQMGPASSLMPSGLPGTYPGFQQIPVNPVLFGGHPLPGRSFSCCPGPSPMHSICPTPMPIGYAVVPRPSMLLPGPPYGQWGPPVGAPPFALDLSERHTMPHAWSLKKVEDGPEKLTPSREKEMVPIGGSAAKSTTEGDLEPEPPVPGLSPPPQAKVPVPVTCSVHGCNEINKVPDRPFCQPWRPPNYVNIRGYSEGTYQNEGFGLRYPLGEHRRDRDLGHEDGVPHVTGIRDERMGFHPGEYWETPEAESFKEDVFALVMTQVQKHKLALDSKFGQFQAWTKITSVLVPNIRTRDLNRFCSKLADVIVRKEVAKYMEHSNQGGEKKVIVKSKLVDKVESYVYNQVELYWRKIEKSHRS